MSVTTQAFSEEADGDAIRPVDIRLSAMNFLARREHSLYELRQKLARRYSAPELVETELQRLAQENLQSDERFAASYARNRAERGFGPLRIRQEMRDRGLTDTHVSIAFEQEGLDWREIATVAYCKKYGTHKIEDIRDRSRRNRFMQYRGFTSDHYQHLMPG